MSDSISPQDQVLEDIEVGKYLDILRRRKWWVILTATAIFVTTLVTVLRMPNVYRSETVILVDPQKVPDAFVPATVNTTVADRLATVRQEVMSPTRLKQLLDETGLYAEERRNGKTDRIIVRLQKAIILEIADPGGFRSTAFKIGYTAENPKEAALVPNHLANMVIQSKVQEGEDQSRGTAEFLDSELQQTKKSLEEKEAEMGKIKTTFIMDLPESKQYHLEALTNLRAQLQASQDRVNRSQEEKIYLQSMTGKTNPTVDLDADATGAASPDEAEAQKLETRLAELRGRYGAGYPDVRKAQSELERLKAKIAEQQKNAAPQGAAPARAARQVTHNPVVEAQLNKIEDDMQEQAKLQKGLEEQINFHSSKLEREPIFEQQLSNLMRDYDMLRTHYNRLLDKKLSADMYSALVSREEGERFVILDSAPVPTQPFGPNRFLYCVTSLVGGLFAGLGLMILREITDQSIRDEREAATILDKGVLAGIPLIVSARQSRGEHMRAALAIATTILFSSGLGLAVSYFMKRLG
jgi:polysaccharide biosynthesis transport protein